MERFYSDEDLSCKRCAQERDKKKQFNYHTFYATFFARCYYFLPVHKKGVVGVILFKNLRKNCAIFALESDSLRKVNNSFGIENVKRRRTVDLTAKIFNVLHTVTISRSEDLN